MTVKKARLENFRAHRHIELDFAPVTVLVGRNNAGKSSLLHAVALPKYGFSEDPALPIGRPHEVATGGAELAKIFLEYSGVPGHLMFSTGPQIGAKWSSDAKSAAGDRASKSVYYISPLRTPERDFRYDQLRDDVGIRGEHAPNIYNQLKTDDDPRAAVIVEWLSRFGMSVGGLGAPTNRPGFGELRPQTFGYRTNLTLAGAGLSAVLPIVVQDVLCKAGDTMLVEEPESHLHRGAIEGLWAFIGDCAQRDVQVICTTHSIEFLVAMHKLIEKRAIDPALLQLTNIRRTTEGSSAHKLDPTVFTSIKHAIATDLAQLD